MNTWEGVKRMVDASDLVDEYKDGLKSQLSYLQPTRLLTLFPNPLTNQTAQAHSRVFIDLQAN